MPLQNKLTRFGFTLLQKFENLIERNSKFGAATFIDSGEFPWVKNIEENWRAIRNELEEILQYEESIPNIQDIQSDQKDLSTDDKWKPFFLFGYGFKAEKNCELCPRTTELVQQIPGMKTAFFSILGPHKHIPPHRGAFKGVLRYHMGLIIPEPYTSCTIRVGEDYAHWQEGKSLIFDDTHNHEVWNRSDQKRVVLFVDFVRPLPFPLSALNKFLIFLISISPFVQEAKKNQSKWDEKLEEAINAKPAE